jgi:hypothetical protein
MFKDPYACRIDVVGGCITSVLAAFAWPAQRSRVDTSIQIQSEVITRKDRAFLSKLSPTTWPLITLFMEFLDCPIEIFQILRTIRIFRKERPVSSKYKKDRHHLLPSLAPSLVPNAAPTKLSAYCCMHYGIFPVSPTGTTGSFPRIDSIGRA